MEAIAAKLARGVYTPEETTWMKIKNTAYSQAEGERSFSRAVRFGASCAIAPTTPCLLAPPGRYAVLDARKDVIDHRRADRP
jgi:hypothetical protein